MKHRRRKIITRAIVFLLLGAIVNVAVAWGCAYYAYRHYETEMLACDISVVLFTNLGVAKYSTKTSDDGGFVLTRSHVVPLEVSTKCFSAAGFRYQTTALRGGPRRITIEGGWPDKSVRGRRDADRLRLPIHKRIVQLREPISRGFAINTIFYAAILWLLFAAPFALRRYVGGRRIKRGLCPACAYPIGSSANCTECGKPVITCAS